MGQLAPKLFWVLRVALRAAVLFRSVWSYRLTGLMRVGAGCGRAMRSVGSRQWYMHPRR